MASPRTAVVVGGVLLALEIADPLLAGLARQSVNDSNGSVPVWFSAAFQTVTAFASRLQDAKDAVDLDTVRDDLAGVVDAALEPAHISVWVKPG
jgi:hypothetical protein